MSLNGRHIIIYMFKNAYRLCKTVMQNLLYFACLNTFIVSEYTHKGFKKCAF